MGRHSVLTGERRWEFLEMAARPLPRTRIAEHFGVMPQTVTNAAARLGIKLVNANTLRTGPRPETRYRDHWPHVIELREKGLTYQRIGASLGISRERVRQILHAAGRSDLCHRYRAKPRPEMTCPVCGERYQGTAVFCSMKCRQRHRNLAFYPRDLPRARAIVAMRKSDKSWDTVAAHQGFGSGPAAQVWLKRFAERHERQDLYEAATGHYCSS